MLHVNRAWSWTGNEAFVFGARRKRDDYVRESETHNDGKILSEFWGEHLKPGWVAHVEKRPDGCSRRPDVTLQGFGVRLAIEIQHSSLAVSEYLSRTNHFIEREVWPLWLWSMNGYFRMDRPGRMRAVHQVTIASGRQVMGINTKQHTFVTAHATRMRLLNPNLFYQSLQITSDPMDDCYPELVDGSWIISTPTYRECQKNGMHQLADDAQHNIDQFGDFFGVSTEPLPVIDLRSEQVALTV